MKRGVLLVSLILLVGFFSISVLAQDSGTGDGGFDDREDELKCLSCGDSCLPYEIAVVAFCEPPTAGEPVCGTDNGECVVLSYEGVDEDNAIVEICHFPSGN